MRATLQRSLACPAHGWPNDELGSVRAGPHLKVRYTNKCHVSGVVLQLRYFYLIFHPTCMHAGMCSNSKDNRYVYMVFDTVKSTCMQTAETWHAEGWTNTSPGPAMVSGSVKK